jgi:hypothetical protein
MHFGGFELVILDRQGQRHGVVRIRAIRAETEAQSESRGEKYRPGEFAGKFASELESALRHHGPAAHPVRALLALDR